MSVTDNVDGGFVDEDIFDAANESVAKICGINGRGKLKVGIHVIDATDVKIASEVETFGDADGLEGVRVSVNCNPARSCSQGQLYSMPSPVIQSMSGSLFLHSSGSEVKVDVEMTVNEFHGEVVLISK